MKGGYRAPAASRGTHDAGATDVRDTQRRGVIDALRRRFQGPARGTALLRRMFGWQDVTQGRPARPKQRDPRKRKRRHMAQASRRANRRS